MCIKCNCMQAAGRLLRCASCEQFIHVTAKLLLPVLTSFG
jgi:hypothetical protein